MRVASSIAKKLRHQQTVAEGRLWLDLKAKRLFGHKFRRQHRIGPYVVDFCCTGRKLIIELDGGQHQPLINKDHERTNFLNSKGYRVIRFWNHELLKDPFAVMDVIHKELINPLPPVAQGTPSGVSHEKREGEAGS